MTESWISEMAVDIGNAEPLYEGDCLMRCNCFSQPFLPSLRMRGCRGGGVFPAIWQFLPWFSRISSVIIECFQWPKGRMGATGETVYAHARVRAHAYMGDIYIYIIYPVRFSHFSLMGEIR